MKAKFVIPGEPKGKGRPRVERHGGKSVTRTPDDTVVYLECSECRRKVWDICQDDALKGNWAKLIEPFPYCHCGAKMHTSCGEEVKQR